MSKYFADEVNKLIENILLISEKSRDCDNVLVANLLKKLNKNLDAETLKWIAYSAPNLESITRARRKLQEQKKELRGAKYEERQRKQEEVKQEVTQWKTI